VSMMVALKVMAYFKISLSTRNWDRAIENRFRSSPDAATRLPKPELDHERSIASWQQRNKGGADFQKPPPW
ncbi:hypothetical protein, partial [Aeromonas jandaei]|uniref:hypothetical protein n=1 Tax=Aeromonas jandaei TaxID=650 RepID=UPI003BA25408